MARRRRNRDMDIALGVAQLMALLVVAGMFLPQVRQMLLGLPDERKYEDVVKEVRDAAALVLVYQ